MSVLQKILSTIIAKIGLRVWLALLVGLVAFPILLVTVFNALHQRSEKLKEAEAYLSETARIAALRQSAAIDSARQVVTALATAPAVRRLDLEGCHSYLRLLRPRLPQYSNFGLAATDGRLICDALSGPDNVSVLDRRYFREALEHRAFSVGDYQIGRRTGKASLGFGMPVLDAGENVVGVVFAAVEADSLGALLADVSLPHGAAVMLVDRGGTLVASLPPEERITGKPLVHALLLDAMFRGNEGLLESDADDGRRWIYAHHVVRADGRDSLYLAVGMEKSRVVGPIDRALRHSLIAIIVVAAAALGAGWVGVERLVAKPIRRLSEVASRVASGDLDARVGGRLENPELARLGADMDAMIGALREREGRLRQSEERFRGLAALSSDWYWEQDVQFRFTAFPSEDVERKSGLLTSAFEGRARWELGAVGVSDAQWREHRATLEAHRPFRDFVYGHYLPNGGIRYVSVSGTPRFDARGGFIGYSGTSRDVSDRVHAEHALQESEERFRLVSNATSDAIWDWDLRDATIWWSESFYYTFGYAPADIEAGESSWYGRIHPDDLESVSSGIRQVIDGGGEDWRDQYRFRRKDGGYADVLDRGRVIRGTDGEPRRMVGGMADITQRLKAEGRLLTQKRVLQMIASGCSLHDTLNAVALSAEEEVPDMHASVLIVDEEKGRLLDAAAPSLPQPLRAAIDGLPIGPASGACGTAAYRNQSVVIENVREDPLCAGFREVAESCGVRACWSTPIRAADGRVIGTFAMYYPKARGPGESERAVIDGCTGLASVAIEKYLTEKRIAESEARYRILVESSPDAIFMQLEGRLAYVNTPGMRMYGAQSTQELIGRPVLDLVDPGDHDEVRERLRRIEALGAERKLEIGEIRQRRLDGGTFVGEVVSSPMVFGGKRGSLTVVRDVTARRAAQDVLEDRDRFFRISHEMLGIFGYDGVCRQVNPAFTRILGYSSHEMKSVSLYDILHPDDVQRAREAMGRVGAGETLNGFEARYRRSDGSYVWMEWSATPHGEELVYGAAREITQRKQAEEALKQLNAELESRVAERTQQLEILNRELEAFSYSVSHDLRAPLRAVHSFAEMLAREEAATLGDKGRHYLDRILAGARHMGDLIEDLLSLAKITRAQMRSRPVDLSAMATRILRELQATEPGRQAEIVVQPDIWVNGDPGLLAIALQNLLANAWKFTAKRVPARIELGCVASEGWRNYYVRDNGAGFDPRHADKLFGVFQRLHNVREFPGTGVGLATVRRIVERHGGRIWAESAVDQGATFYFNLGQQ